MTGFPFRIAFVATITAPLVGVALEPTVLIHETFDENDGGGGGRRKVSHGSVPRSRTASCGSAPW